MLALNIIFFGWLTRRKVLKVAKIKDANYGCKDEGNDDGVSHQSVVRVMVYVMVCMMVCVILWIMVSVMAYSDDGFTRD